MSSTDTPTETPVEASEPTTDSAANVFSLSVLISGIRCTLTYVVFPWLLPLFGFAAGVGSVVGLVVGVVAIFFNVLSIRRVWRSDFRHKWAVTVFNVAVICLLCVLIGMDVADLS